MPGKKGFRVESTDSLPDGQLVRRVLAGEVPLFEVLVHRHSQRLYRAARSILRDDEEAADIVQETWVRAYRKLGQFAGRAKFSTWLTRIGVYEARARWRKLRTRALPEREPAAAREAQPQAGHRTRSGASSSGSGTESGVGSRDRRSARSPPPGLRDAGGGRNEHRRDRRGLELDPGRRQDAAAPGARVAAREAPRGGRASWTGSFPVRGAEVPADVVGENPSSDHRCSDASGSPRPTLSSYEGLIRRSRSS